MATWRSFTFAATIAHTILDVEIPLTAGLAGARDFGKADTEKMSTDEHDQISAREDSLRLRTQVGRRKTGSDGSEQTPCCVDFNVLTIGVTVTFFESAIGLTGSLGVALAVSLLEVTRDGRRSGEAD